MGTRKTRVHPFRTVAIMILFEISDTVIQKLTELYTALCSIKNYRADKTSHAYVKSCKGATVGMYVTGLYGIELKILCYLY